MTPAGTKITGTQRQLRYAETGAPAKNSVTHVFSSSYNPIFGDAVVTDSEGVAGGGPKDR